MDCSDLIGADVSTLAATVKCHAVHYQPHMNRLLPVPGDEYAVFNKDALLLPVDDLTVKAGVKVAAGFVVRRVMQLDAENVPVVEGDQSPAIQRLKRTGAVSPRQASNLVDEFLFKHSSVQGTIQVCREG